MNSRVLSTMLLSYIIILSIILITKTTAFRSPNTYLSINGFPYESHRVDTRSARRYCGSEITRTLNFLCESYNKRSSINKVINDQDLETNSVEETNDTPKYSLALVQLLRNNNDLRHFRRQIRGVVDDCCKRSCTTTQLSQYCDVVRLATTTTTSPSD